MTNPGFEQWREAALRANDANQSWFAARSIAPGVVLFLAERADAPEFDLAMIHQVSLAAPDETLLKVQNFFTERRREVRVRLSPCSTPADWPGRLRRAGFVETDEPLGCFAVPETVLLLTNPAIQVKRVRTLAEADQFSAVQVAGFDLPANHHDWDRTLVRRQLTADRWQLYLGRLDGRSVGAARGLHLPGGVTSLAALATLPGARGLGVGTSLLARMIADARRAGSRLIVGDFVPGSTAARWYWRIGFRPLFRLRTFAAITSTAVTGRRDSAS